MIVTPCDHAERECDTLRAVVDTLTTERDEAREVVAKVNNSITGSYGYFVDPHPADQVEVLKTYFRAVHHQADVLRAQLAEALRDNEQHRQALKVCPQCDGWQIQDACHCADGRLAEATATQVALVGALEQAIARIECSSQHNHPAPGDRNRTCPNFVRPVYVNTLRALLASPSDAGRALLAKLDTAKAEASKYAMMYTDQDAEVCQILAPALQWRQDESDPDPAQILAAAAAERLTALLAELAALRAGLEKYGQHTRGCALLGTHQDDMRAFVVVNPGPCSCGLAALVFLSLGGAARPATV